VDLGFLDANGIIGVKTICDRNLLWKKEERPKCAAIISYVYTAKPTTAKGTYSEGTSSILHYLNTNTDQKVRLRIRRAKKLKRNTNRRMPKVPNDEINNSRSHKVQSPRVSNKRSCHQRGNSIL
jgi:hypothetical protein